MGIGIIGLPLSGKTTIFNAVTRGRAEVASFKAAAQQPNIGVVKVPDSRLEPLSDIAKSKKIVPAEIEYLDIPTSAEGIGSSKGIDGNYLNLLQRCEGLIITARSFANPSVPIHNETIDPFRDIQLLVDELALSDLSILERRKLRISNQFKGAKSSEKENLTRESELINTISDSLENGTPVRAQNLSDSSTPYVENFQLLTSKPLIVLFNIDEGQINDIETIERPMKEKISMPETAMVAICGNLEMDLAQMNPPDADEFRDSMGIKHSALDRMIETSYDLLGLMSFITTGEDETRAWTIKKDTMAVDAAAKIHTDIQRGFIRAEVVNFEDLLSVGSIAEVKKLGKFRQEGKNYIMKDGDVVNFLFNI